MFRQTDLQKVTNIESLLSLSDMDFEWCCKFLLEKAGYGKAFVTKKGPKGGDGGIDLDIYSADGRLIACGQCKLWKSRFKGLMKPIRELCGSMKIKGVSHGIFIITVDATPDEKREAQLMDIEMIDASALLLLIKKYVRIEVKKPISATIKTSFTKNQNKGRGRAAHKIVDISLSLIGFFLVFKGHVLIGSIVIFLAFLSMRSTPYKSRQ